MISTIRDRSVFVWTTNDLFLALSLAAALGLALAIGFFVARDHLTAWWRRRGRR